MAFDDTFRRGEIPAWWKHTISKRYVRGWGVCPAHLRTPSLRSSQSGSKMKFYLIFGDSVLSACVYSCLTFGRDRVMVPLSLGQKGNSVIATRPGEQWFLSAKEKEKHLLNTTAWTRGKASGQMPGGLVVFSTKFHPIRLVQSPVLHMRCRGVGWMAQGPMNDDLLGPGSSLWNPAGLPSVHGHVSVNKPCGKI